jgi:8-oxo-dGTP pyrophosphatase MutT (NUDIX family)
LTLYPNDPGFQHHVRACNNAELPGTRTPFLILDQPVGYVARPIALALQGMAAVRCLGDRVVLDDPSALPGIARTLSERGHYRWRGEAFDVRAHPDGPALAQIDRGAVPSFGVQAVGVHVNGLVRRAEGLHLWVARRAMDKRLDPGKLDHIVAGGVSAGMGPAETLVKEAGEEAGIPPDLASAAVKIGEIVYAMDRPEGLRRDLVHCFDLDLPSDFVPVATDGEVAGFELWPIARVVETVRTTDDFKFNVNLVLIDLFRRLRLIASADRTAERGESAIKH